MDKSETHIDLSCIGLKEFSCNTISVGFTECNGDNSTILVNWEKPTIALVQRHQSTKRSSIPDYEAFSIIKALSDLKYKPAMTWLRENKINKLLAD